MKKRGFLVGVFICFLVLAFPCVLAEQNQTKIDNAYDCLTEMIEDKDCSKLSLDEKIFSLLSVKKCKQEIIEEKNQNLECWPESSCKLKQTAQTILALKETNSDTGEAEEWLLAQNQSPTELKWMLQVETKEAASCSVEYDGTLHSFSIGADKKLISEAGTCLDLFEGDWWFKISPRCYEKEFKITCDKSFASNLLFYKEDSNVVHVLDETHSATADGTTSEKINSFCFFQGTSCDYEGSLWTALVLKSLDYDVSSYLPYLILLSEENAKYLPEAFLTYIAGDPYRNDLLLKQKQGYWEVSGDKFYDTALALYPLYYDSGKEKTDATEWLLEKQDVSGCWNNNNLLDTAFILYSVWPESYKGGTTPPTPPGDSCEGVGGYCMSSIDCANINGNELSAYSSTCYGMTICCDKEKVLESCEEMSGQICGVGKQCSESTIQAGDTLECCLGTCNNVTSPQDSECLVEGGACREDGCLNDEEEKDYACKYYGDSCCFDKAGTGTGTGEGIKSTLWIWILLILIVLVLLGIVYKNKLKTFWFRINSKFKKSGKSKKTPPKFPPSSMGSQRRRVPRNSMPRRIIPTQQPRRPIQRMPKADNSQKELDDVLKKLKDMSK